MQTSGSIEIDQPIDDVFRLTTEHVAEWSIIVVKDEILEQKPEGVGTTFRTVTEENGKQLEFQGIVTRYEPPHSHAIRLTGALFDIETEFHFEELSGRTRVTQRAHVSGKGFFRVFLFFFGWLMHKSHCRAFEKELRSLKRFCEQQPTISR